MFSIKNKGRFWVKRIILLIALFSGLFFNNISYSQLLGNEWINYSQFYYKFPIIKTGIYHIDSISLANAGITVSSFDARNLQLFFRGEEIPIYVKGESDGVFNATDYIEFFGEPNDGWIDTALYINGAADQMNPGLNLFNDTSMYYLSWNTSTTNIRYTLETDTDFASYTPANYYIYKAREGLFGGGSNGYYAGELISTVSMPEYTEGEGYCYRFGPGTSYTGSWSGTVLTGLNNTIYTGGGSPLSFLKLHIASTNDPSSTVNDHHHQITVADGLVVDTILGAYHFYQRKFTISSSALAASTNPFKVDFLADLSASNNAIGYYELIMPQLFDLTNRTEQLMYLPDDAIEVKERVDITNFNTLSSPAWLFDLENNRKITLVDNAGTLQGLIPNSGSAFAKKIYISSDAAVLNVPDTAIHPVSADPTHYAKFRDFVNELNDRDYIIITHPSLWNEAEVYENHRWSSGFTPLLIDINELYDQFGFGIRHHPICVRNFLKMTNNSWTVKPKHVFLIGKSIRHDVLGFILLRFIL